MLGWHSLVPIHDLAHQHIAMLCVKATKMADSTHEIPTSPTSCACVASHRERVGLARPPSLYQLGLPIGAATGVCHFVVVCDTWLQACNICSSVVKGGVLPVIRQSRCCVSAGCAQVLNHAPGNLLQYGTSYVPYSGCICWYLN